MRKGFKLYTECSMTCTTRKATQLGFACMIAGRSKTYSAFKMLSLRLWLEQAIDHQQIQIFFDCTSNPIGYITWANLAPDVEGRLLSDSQFFLDPAEWDEGEKTWIIDCCFIDGASVAVRALKKIFVDQGIAKVYWARRNPDYSVKRIGSVKLV